MKIRYLGHSCFLFVSETGTRIVTDPYGDVGFRMPAVSADVVTVSHSHYDHNATDAVGGSPVVLSREGEYMCGGVTITAVGSYHDDVRGAKRGKNLIFGLNIDGLKVVHLGDLGEPCTEERAAQLRPADILLIPVGGVYTIDAAGAKAYVDATKPPLVIPMHYGAKGLNIPLAPPSRFLSLFEGAEECGKSELEITKENLPASGTKIIKMERYI